MSNFMRGFKSAILEKLKNCQNGTFEPLHEIWKSFWPKSFSSSIMKMAIRKNIHKMSQGPPNPGFMQAKVQKGDFLKKLSLELKKKKIGFYQSLEGLECYIRSGYFFGNLKTCTDSVSSL